MCTPFPAIDPVATGENITRLRNARGLTVRDLQAYFGFGDPRAIYKWQRGQTLPSVDNLFALSALLQVPMNEILVPVNAQANTASAERQAESCRSVLFCRFGRLKGRTTGQGDSHAPLLTRHPCSLPVYTSFSRPQTICLSPARCTPPVLGYGRCTGPRHRLLHSAEPSSRWCGGQRGAECYHHLVVLRERSKINSEEKPPNFKQRDRGGAGRTR